MKSIKKLPIAIAFLVVFMISFTPSYAAVPGFIPVEPPRDQVLWSTGAAANPRSFKPFAVDPEPWVCIMYETLYGFNTVTNKYVPVLGLDEPTWAVDGSYIDVDINPLAMWSDGTPVNSTDVCKSYELAEMSAKFAAELPTRFSSYEELDNDSVRFHIVLGKEFSRMALNFLCRDVPILPYDIWESINTTYSGNIDLYDNDWIEGAYPEANKRTSAPYVPVYRDAQLTTSVYQYRDDWWGAGVLYQDLPNVNDTRAFPKYVGHRVMGDNDVKNLAFIQGNIDLHSGAISNIWELWENPANKYGTYIASYYIHDSPYFACLGGTICVGVNQQHWKATGHVSGDLVMNEIWFREALAYAIDYDPIPIPAVGGYWKRAMPGLLDDIAHSFYYNPAMEAYKRNYNITKATQIMEDHGCSLVSGEWQWDSNSTKVVSHPWTMITPKGWGDVGIFTEMVTDNFQTFGLDIDEEYISGWDTNWGVWENPIVDKDYDLMMDCGGAHNILEPMLYYKKLQDTPGWGSNVTGWYNYTWLSLYNSLETEDDPVVFADTLDEMQVILAKEIPSIPCFVNAFLYAYDSYYWEGWTNKDNNYQQVITTATNDQWAAKAQFILNMRATGRKDAGIPWTGLELFMLIGLVSTIVLAGYKIKKARK